MVHDRSDQHLHAGVVTTGVEPRTRQPDLMTSQFKLPAGGGGCRGHGSSSHGVST